MESFAYFKYEGDDITDGVFGARDSAEALWGLDKALRYCTEQELPELKKIKYEFPVKIQPGSWEILLPENIADIMQVVKDVGMAGCIIVPLTVYLKGIAETAAKDGLFEAGPIKDLKKILEGALLAIQWFVRYIKHIRGSDASPRIDSSDNENSVTIINKEGDSLTIPYDIYTKIIRMPSDVIEGMVLPVNERHSLKIGVKIGGVWREDSITNVDRPMFCKESQTADELPELFDGARVSITGRVMRANEKDQSFGLQYKGHVLTCKPEEGKQLATFKHGLISTSSNKIYQGDVNVEGVVERVTVDGREKTRPRLFVSSVVPTGVEGVEIKQDDFTDALT